LISSSHAKSYATKKNKQEDDYRAYPINPCPIIIVIVAIIFVIKIKFTDISCTIVVQITTVKKAVTRTSISHV
jgi:hypothetical protein